VWDSFNALLELKTSIMYMEEQKTWWKFGDLPRSLQYWSGYVINNEYPLCGFPDLHTLIFDNSSVITLKHAILPRSLRKLVLPQTYFKRLEPGFLNDGLEDLTLSSACAAYAEGILCSLHLPLSVIALKFTTSPFGDNISECIWPSDNFHNIQRLQLSSCFEQPLHAHHLGPNLKWLKLGGRENHHIPLNFLPASCETLISQFGILTFEQPQEAVANPSNITLNYNRVTDITTHDLQQLPNVSTLCIRVHMEILEDMSDSRFREIIACLPQTVRVLSILGFEINHIPSDVRWPPLITSLKIDSVDQVSGRDILPSTLQWLDIPNFTYNQETSVSIINSLPLGLQSMRVYGGYTLHPLTVLDVPLL
jgi:hypothetical protein